MPVSYDESVKRPGIELEYSQDMIQELIRCKKDVIYFLKYIKIVSLDKGRIPFEPYGFQKDLIELFDKENFVIAMIFRQAGKTTVVGSYALHYAIFNEDKYVGIAANNASMATEILDRIKLMYEELPDWIKPGVKEYAKTSITFENGTKIVVRPCSPSAFRGRSINLLILDEFAHPISNKLALQFWQSNYPTVSSSESGKIIIISTPKGMGNLFHDIWSDAERGKGAFKCYKADWRAARSEEWAKKHRETLDDITWNQEFELEFLGSTSTIVNASTVKRLLADVREPISVEYNGKVRIYEERLAGAVYIAGTDTAKGSGEHDSTIQIARVESLRPVKLKHVASFQDNFTDTYHFADIIFKLATYYNNAFIVIENNSEGDGVIKRLYYDYEYENMVNEGGTVDKLGVRATKKTKPRAVLLMKKLLEEDSFELHDDKTVKQLASFVDDNGKMHGNDGAPDDLVSGLYWCCYALTFDLFDESSEIPQAKEMDDEAWGIIGGDDDEDDIENFWNNP